MSAFGGIQVADAATLQTVWTDGRLTKLNCFTGDFGARGSDGSVVEDSANDQIKLQVGVYQVEFYIDFDAPAALVTFQFHVRTGPASLQYFTELPADIQSTVDVPLTTEAQSSAKAKGFLEIKASHLDSNGFAAVAVFMEQSGDESSSSSSTNSSSSSSNSSSSSSNSSSSSSSSSTTNSSSSSASESSSRSSGSSSSSSSVVGGPRITVRSAQLCITKIP